MARYLIESAHTAEECLKALDEMAAMEDNSLAKWDWGCMAGDHRGWLITEAADENAARQMVPAGLQPKTTIVPLNKFSRQDIAEFHKKIEARA